MRFLISIVDPTGEARFSLTSKLPVANGGLWPQFGTRQPILQAGWLGSRRSETGRSTSGQSSRSALRHSVMILINR